MILQFVYYLLATHFAQLKQQNKRSHKELPIQTSLSDMGLHLLVIVHCIIQAKPQNNANRNPPKPAPRFILFTVRSTHSDRSLFHTSQLAK